MAVKVTDDMGRDLLLGRPPKRIVSLVPSETYTVAALGAGDRLVGRTDYCVLPAEVSCLPSVGGTKDVDPEKVCALEPDLVLANQEENARGPLEALAALRVPVFVSFPRRVAEGFSHMARLARMLGLADDARVKQLMATAYRSLRRSEDVAREQDRMPRVFVPIWDQPLMTFNDDTFAHDLLLQAGLRNVFADRERAYPLAADLGRRSPVAADRLGDRDRRYPRVTEAEVIERAPDLVLLPDEPYRFGIGDVERFSAQGTPASRAGQVRLVDGKDLFWPGARAVEALEHLRAMVATLAAAPVS